MTPTHLFLIGATHRTAPFRFRERLALSPEAESGLAAELRATAGVEEFVILNTCNRVEIYVVGTVATGAAQVRRAYCARQGVNPDEFAVFGLECEDEAVVTHLLEVAAGLDSQLLGENEIFGQAKRAYATAQERGTTGAVLNRLFQKAFQAAKHVRSATAISAGQVSIANVAVDLAQSIFGSLSEASVLLIGAGDMSEKAGRAFRSRGAKQLTVSSRRLERAQALATDLAAEALDFTQREARLAGADIVVCSTAAPTAVVSLEAVQSALAARGGRPLLLIDLAMPRDIDPDAAALTGCFLYNLDDLATVAERNRQARLAEAERCRALLADRQAALWHAIARQLAGEDVRAARPDPHPAFTLGTVAA